MLKKVGDKIRLTDLMRAEIDIEQTLAKIKEVGE
jgi:hypothetical protein